MSWTGGMSPRDEDPMSAIQPGTRIKPAYPMSAPNEEIKLRQEATKVTVGSTGHAGQGTVTLARLPVPRILCHVENTPCPANIEFPGGAVRLEIPGAAGPVAA